MRLEKFGGTVSKERQVQYEEQKKVIWSMSLTLMVLALSG